MDLAFKTTLGKSLLRQLAILFAATYLLSNVPEKHFKHLNGCTYPDLHNGAIAHPKCNSSKLS